MRKQHLFYPFLTIVLIISTVNCIKGQMGGFGSSSDFKKDGFIKKPVVLEAYWNAVHDPLGELAAFDNSSSGFLIKLRRNTGVTPQYPFAVGGGLAYKRSLFDPVQEKFYEFTVLQESGNKTYRYEAYNQGVFSSYGIYFNGEILLDEKFLLAPKLGFYRTSWTINGTTSVYGESKVDKIDYSGNFMSISPGLEAKYFLTPKFGLAIDYDYNFQIETGGTESRSFKSWQISLGAFLQLWGGNK